MLDVGEQDRSRCESGRISPYERDGLMSPDMNAGARLPH